jgi:hypothetical protein
MDKWLKASIMVAMLLAGAGVFYHFVFVLPAVMQANRDKDEADKSEGSPASARRAAYEECRQGAHLAYDVHWASACMSTPAKPKPSTPPACGTRRSPPGRTRARRIATVRSSGTTARPIAPCRPRVPRPSMPS